MWVITKSGAMVFQFNDKNHPSLSWSSFANVQVGTDSQKAQNL